jgi:heat shock protein HtpX
MATLYTQEASNVRKTWLLMTVFFVLIIALGFIFSVVYSSPRILYFAFFFSLFLNISSYWFSDKIVLSMAHATEITSKNDYPELWNSVENLCITAGLPMPRLYIIDDPAPNAFATGRNKEHAVIAVTTGLLPLLNKSELEGVLAHELSHIGNRDMLIQTAVVVFAGLISFVADIALRVSFSTSDEKRNPLFLFGSVLVVIFAPLAATIIRLAISRQREFLADASGALLTRYPEGLASALQKISNFHQPMKVQNNAIAHLYISNPTGVNHENDIGEYKKVSFMSRLFMTHPPVEERVEALIGKKAEGVV